MIHLRLMLIPFFLAVPLFVAGLAMGWTRAQPEPKATSAGALDPLRRLDYILIEINGIPRTVRNGEELHLIRGDKLLVREAYLHRGLSPKEVQVVGLTRTRSGTPDARGTEFRTKDLASRQSEGGKGQIYAIMVRTKKELHGVAYLRIQEPTLRYAEVTINNQKRVIRDGEVLKVSPKDLFKLDRIVTNLEGDEGVVFQIADGSHGERAIRFLRHGIAFATVPLVIEE
jgi:hypothetical protein